MTPRLQVTLAEADGLLYHLIRAPPLPLQFIFKDLGYTKIDSSMVAASQTPRCPLMDQQLLGRETGCCVGVLLIDLTLLMCESGLIEHPTHRSSEFRDLVQHARGVVQDDPTDAPARHHELLRESANSDGGTRGDLSVPRLSQWGSGGILIPF